MQGQYCWADQLSPCMLELLRCHFHVSVLFLSFCDRDLFCRYFNENTEVAPSFQGEMPQKYARVVEAFKHPLSETAFVPGEGIANYPPEEQVQEVKKEVTKEQLIRSLMEATPGQEFQKSAISFN